MRVHAWAVCGFSRPAFQVPRALWHSRREWDERQCNPASLDAQPARKWVLHTQHEHSCHLLFSVCSLCLLCVGLSVVCVRACVHLCVACACVWPLVLSACPPLPLCVSVFVHLAVAWCL